MQQTLDIVCPLPNGLHARPANRLEELVRPFNATITITNERTGESADLKSILSVISLDVRLNDPIRFSVSGPEAQSTYARLAEFTTHEFPHCDEALPAISVSGDAVVLPPSLAMHAPAFIAGTPAVAGLARGILLKAQGGVLPEDLRFANHGASVEQEKLERALLRTRSQLEQQTLGQSENSVETAVLRAHLSFLHDPQWLAAMRAGVEGGACAGEAICKVAHCYKERLDATGNALLRERALDLFDLCSQLLEEIYGQLPGSQLPLPAAPSIVIAENLTPSQFKQLRQTGYLDGMVLTEAGPTCHTVILARSFGIPVLLGASSGFANIQPGEPVILDTRLGILLVSPFQPVQQHYERQFEAARRRGDRLSQWSSADAITMDGFRLEIAVNVGSAEEAGTGFEAGADGVGLFRSELLFMDRTELPSEDEQAEIYRQVLSRAAGKPVIVRTLDVGGDKPLACLRLPREENPFLGYRGVRIYGEHSELIRTQIRALLRASSAGPLKVMIPMVSRPEEMQFLKGALAELQEELAATGWSSNHPMELGMMVETPAAAFDLESFCPYADFFSVGTNDLAQYFFCADRGNPRVAGLCNYRQPSFLRLLQHVVSCAKRHGKWIGICGEMGANDDMLPFLVGLGFDEISMPPSAIATAKRRIARLRRDDCADQLAQFLLGKTHAPIADGAEMPILTPQLICMNGSAATKQGAIRELVDALYAELRTNAPDQLELDIWSREAVYSTGFGEGFAVPHCKSNAVSACTLAIGRFAAPLDWGASDGQPVHHVFLLAMPAEAGVLHLQLFSRLARKLVNPLFREQIHNASNKEQLLGILEQEVLLAG